MLSDARIRFQKGSLFSNKLLGRLCKNQQEIFTWTHFWVLHSTPHTHGHSPDQEHTVVITVSLEWGRPSERVSIPLYSSFSKLFLAILGPMPLHTNYFPALLRYSWHKIMGKFKVHDVMNVYVENDHHNAGDCVCHLTQLLNVMRLWNPLSATFCITHLAST